MKIRILAVFSAAIMLLGFVVCAQSPEYSINTDEDFTVVYAGDNLSEMSEKLNISEAELSSYFTKNGLLYLAVSADNQTQIRLSRYTDNFSSTVRDISILDDDGLQEFANTVCGYEEYTITENSGRKFIVSVKNLTDSGGRYTVTQYITIHGGSTYYLSCYNAGDVTSDEINAVFDEFSLTEDVQVPKISVANELLVICGIVVFSIIAIVAAFGIVRSYIKKSV